MGCAIDRALIYMGGDRSRSRLPLALDLMTATASRPRLPRTLADLEAHPWIDWIDDGRHLGDGLHVYLKSGYVWAGTASAVIESTVREACQAFREVIWDPAAWAEAGGHSAAEVAALTGEAVPSVADAARRPTLPGEATPPPAPSHGEAAPTLPAITEHPCPVGNGDPARAEAVVEMPGGVAVICTGSSREAFRLPDTVSVCGAAAALEAGGWVLSPALEALARRWRDITGGQDPAPEVVAIAEAAAPKLKRFRVFHRTWWRKNADWPDGREPGVGKSHHVGWANTEAHARHLCRRWNATHTPGPLSDRAEFETA
jgi:hypothetical protein